jgi:hypothetical protein
LTNKLPGFAEHVKPVKPAREKPLFDPDRKLSDAHRLITNPVGESSLNLNSWMLMKFSKNLFIYQTRQISRKSIIAAQDFLFAGRFAILLDRNVVSMQFRILSVKTQPTRGIFHEISSTRSFCPISIRLF